MLTGDWFINSGEMTSLFSPFGNDCLLLLSCRYVNVLGRSPLFLIGFSNIFSRVVDFPFVFLMVFLQHKSFELVEVEFPCACFLSLVLGVPCLETPCLTSVHKGQLLCCVLSSIALMSKPKIFF